MITKETGATKGLNKGQLEDRIEEDERTFGVITKIDCAQNGTVITLNREVAAPAGKVTVEIDPAPCPPGKTQVCSGRAYVSGVCVKVLICR